MTWRNSVAPSSFSAGVAAERDSRSVSFSPAPRAGWYPDPDDPEAGRFRFWDGERWTDRYTGGQSRWRWLIWVVGLLLVGLSATLIVIRERDESLSEAIGAPVGGLIFAFAVALVARAIYVRFIAKGSGLWSPWVLVIAGLVGLLSTLAVTRQEREELVQDFEDAASECRALDEERFPPLEGDLSYAPLGVAAQRRLADFLPADLQEVFIAKRILRDRAFVGYVVTAPLGTDAEDYAGARDGFQRAAREQGFPIEQTRVETRELTYTRGPRGLLVALLEGSCYITNIYAFGDAELLVIARGIAR